MNRLLLFLVTKVHAEYIGIYFRLIIFTRVIVYDDLLPALDKFFSNSIFACSIHAIFIRR